MRELMNLFKMEQIPEKPTMRFLSFENDKEDAETKAKLKEAAEKIEQAIAREKSLSELIDFKQTTEETIDPANDTRPLYERLLEQKNKKKEALEDSNKLSNLVTKLDEDEANYLNDVARMRQEEEIKKRLEVYDVLEEKKRMTERRILDDEQKLKELLIGSRPNDRGPTSSLKSKLSALIRVKPKAKTSVELEPSQMSKTKDTAESSTPTQRTKRSLPADQASKDEILTNDEIKRPKVIEPNRAGAESKEQRQKTEPDEQTNCDTRQKNVMKCIGILPSMPIVSDFHNSSEDSDDSSNNLNVRILPRLGKRRRR